MWQGIRVIRWLMVINLALVGLQALSAGFFLSGYRYAAAVHSSGAAALQVGALLQAIAAVILWRRRSVPAWVASVSTAFFVIVFLQAGLGFRKTYWLHVPIAVGMFSGLMRHVHRLDAVSAPVAAQSGTERQN